MVGRLAGLSVTEGASLKKRPPPLFLAIHPSRLGELLNKSGYVITLLQIFPFLTLVLRKMPKLLLWLTRPFQI